MILRHGGGIFEGLQPFDPWLPGAFQQAAGEVIGMGLVQASSRLGQFEELSQALIEPERDAGYHGMEVAMGGLVPKVLGDPLLPRQVR